MTYELLYEFFKWCSIFNIIFYAWWAAWVMFAPNFTYKTQSKWFDIPKDEMIVIHYRFLGFYKLAIILFNLIPWLALWKIG